MSLRLRLALVVVALVAVALLVSDAVTYTSLRAFLMRRVDQQLVEAVGPVGRALHRLPAAGIDFSSLPTNSETASPGASPEVRPPVMVPPGTYGELRKADGQVLRSGQFTYGDTLSPTPALPADLPLATALGNDPPAITVKANDGSSVRFRVLATPDGSGILVVAVPLTEVSQTLGRLLVVELILSAGVLLGLAALSWWVVRRGLCPLERMAATAAAIAEGDLSRRVQVTNPRTEVGRLGLALNAMLTQIEQAFAQRLASENRLRRFLADASHELRTPLTAIRGYAELFRRGAHKRPQDLAKSMQRIEEEATRMSILVQDMLLLARLDQARPLERQPVDLAAIARDAAQDARAADPSRMNTVVAPSPVVVVGDQDRLRQVASNLLNNALTHTPQGTPVEVSVQMEEGRAVLAVADWGPGLSADEAEHAFEPFYRADKARSRDHGGSGLGLSIVAAIAAAHNGSADVTRARDGGALFRVFLPLDPAVPAGQGNTP